MSDVKNIKTYFFNLKNPFYPPFLFTTIFADYITHKAEQIYVTLFDKREEQHYLIKLLEQRGFSFWGKKKDELVYIRDL